MTKFGEYLSNHNIKPSIQRLMIYDYLYRKHNHPTADTIFLDLSPSLPTLSKTTVYNTLKLFVSKGIAVIVNIEDNEVRYDADTSIHGHFKCTGCGEIFDFRMGKDIEFSGLDDFKIEEYHFNLKGRCKICNSN